MMRSPFSVTRDSVLKYDFFSFPMTLLRSFGRRTPEDSIFTISSPACSKKSGSVTEVNRHQVMPGRQWVPVRVRPPTDSKPAAQGFPFRH